MKVDRNNYDDTFLDKMSDIKNRIFISDLRMLHKEDLIEVVLERENNYKVRMANVSCDRCGHLLPLKRVVDYNKASTRRRKRKNIKNIKNMERV